MQQLMEVLQTFLRSRVVLWNALKNPCFSASGWHHGWQWPCPLLPQPSQWPRMPLSPSVHGLACFPDWTLTYYIENVSILLHSLWWVRRSELLTKALDLLMTHIVYLIYMHSLVSKKVWVTTEALTTFFTLVGPHSCMDPEMHMKIWILTEALTTLIAFIWFLPGMISDVSKSMSCNWSLYCTRHMYKAFLPGELWWVWRTELYAKAFPHTLHV